MVDLQILAGKEPTSFFTTADSLFMRDLARELLRRLNEDHTSQSPEARAQPLEKAHYHEPMPRNGGSAAGKRKADYLDGADWGCLDFTWQPRMLSPWAEVVYSCLCHGTTPYQRISRSREAEGKSEGLHLCEIENNVGGFHVGQAKCVWTGWMLYLPAPEAGASDEGIQSLCPNMSS
jgi:hypothetical protein